MTDINLFSEQRVHAIKLVLYSDTEDEDEIVQLDCAPKPLPNHSFHWIVILLHLSSQWDLTIKRFAHLIFVFFKKQIRGHGGCSVLRWNVGNGTINDVSALRKKWLNEMTLHAPNAVEHSP